MLFGNPGEIVTKPLLDLYEHFEDLGVDSPRFDLIEVQKQMEFAIIRTPIVASQPVFLKKHIPIMDLLIRVFSENRGLSFGVVFWEVNLDFQQTGSLFSGVGDFYWIIR